jgi:hypothetical protein
MAVIQMDDVLKIGLSDNDKQTMHELNTLLEICKDHNDMFTSEERHVLGKCIGMYIGTFESEILQSMLTALVVDKWYNQILKG